MTQQVPTMGQGRLRVTRRVQPFTSVDVPTYLRSKPQDLYQRTRTGPRGESLHQRPPGGGDLVSLTTRKCGVVPGAPAWPGVPCQAAHVAAYSEGLSCVIRDPFFLTLDARCTIPTSSPLGGVLTPCLTERDMHSNHWRSVKMQILIW